MSRAHFSVDKLGGAWLVLLTMTKSVERAPACQILEAKGIPHTEIARVWGCTPSNVSKTLAGEHRPSDKRRIVARDTWGIPLEAWLLPSELPQSEKGATS